MKFCFECGRITSGEPLFCGFCGRSYDVKLCPRLHANPRCAEVCSQCGSRELSTPQPRVSFWWKILGFLLQVAFGVFLVVLSLNVLVAILKSPVVQNGLVVLGLLLIGLWAAWAMIPDWLQKLSRKVLVQRRIRRRALESTVWISATLPIQPRWESFMCQTAGGRT